MAKPVEYSWDDVYFDLNKPCQVRVGLIERPTEEPASHFKSKKTDTLPKSVLIEGFERLRELPSNCRAKQVKVKAKPPELDEEVKKDLELLKMRTVLDPKHFYKQDKNIGVSNKVQVGVVVDSPIDFYSSRLPKKQRKQTLVDELLADANFQKFNKRRFVNIIEERKTFDKKAYRIAKRLKRKRK